MASPISCAKLTAWTFAAVLLQILGLSLFIVGFFPVKPTLPGKSGLESYRMPTCGSATDAEVEMPPEQLSSSYKEHSKIRPAYDQLILMVVDGLPAEFILGRGDKPPPKSLMEAMPYTQTLLSDGKAIAYHARAAPPTVTMPRLKAMVSGAIGDQFYRIGWKMVMFGDNTWSKLFPGLFTREDGVSSFYVKDTVEVDLNVSRHLEIELAANDWNLLILHYLGLDHVGHIGGRRSALMVPKLKEMDDVIMMIHMNRILHQDKSQGRTLLVVVSDHGMTDGGNHGGSSYEETDSLALFIGGDTATSHFSAKAHNSAFQVAALHFLGMAGHFGLGNSNSLATLDVAGAFIGISSHSTVLSGILMFIITYASPLLSFLCMIMSISTKDMRYYPTPAKRKFGCMLRTMIAFPCLLPLVLNSIILSAFTIILLLMRNHLFVWSVFSPKYLYICAATVSVYIGVFIIAATGVYVSTVLSFRTNMFKSYTASS